MGRRKILDKFTKLPISRQRKWQMRKLSNGGCISCGKPRQSHSHHCDACYVDVLRAVRIRQNVKNPRVDNVEHRKCIRVSVG